MNDSKLKWMGTDDDKIKEPLLLKDEPGFMIALNQQEIRTFSVEYWNYDPSFLN